MGIGSKKLKEDSYYSALTTAEKWGKFLIYADDKTKRDYISKLCESEAGIMAAQVTLAKISKDEENWLRQTAREKGERDYLSAINEATRRGIAEGLSQAQSIIAEQAARIHELEQLLKKAE